MDRRSRSGTHSAGSAPSYRDVPSSRRRSTAESPSRNGGNSRAPNSCCPASPSPGFSIRLVCHPFGRRARRAQNCRQGFRGFGWCQMQPEGFTSMKSSWPSRQQADGFEPNRVPNTRYTIRSRVRPAAVEFCLRFEHHEPTDQSTREATSPRAAQQRRRQNREPLGPRSARSRSRSSIFTLNSSKPRPRRQIPPAHSTEAPRNC